MSKARRTSSTVALGTVRRLRRCTDCGLRSDDRSRLSRRRCAALRFEPRCSVVKHASSRSVSSSGRSAEVQRQVEGVEVAPAPICIEPFDPPVDDQRHALLGDAAVRAQRRSSPDRSWRLRLVPSTELRSATTTRSPMRSGGSSKRRAASARGSTTSMPGSARRLVDHAGVGVGRSGRRRRTSRARRDARRTGR